MSVSDELDALYSQDNLLSPTPITPTRKAATRGQFILPSDRDDSDEELNRLYARKGPFILPSDQEEAAERQAQAAAGSDKLETENFLKAIPSGVMDALTRHLSAGAQAEAAAMSQPQLQAEIPQPQQ